MQAGLSARPKTAVRMKKMLTVFLRKTPPTLLSFLHFMRNATRNAAPAATGI